jgi:recombination protein RecT
MGHGPTHPTSASQREPPATVPRPRSCCCATVPRGSRVLMTRRSQRPVLRPAPMCSRAAASTPPTRRPMHRRGAGPARATAPDPGDCRHPGEFRGTGRVAGAPADGSAATRQRHCRIDRKARLRAVRERGLVLAADEVFVLAHWITDRDLPRRFDVPFLVARMPAGPEPGGRRVRAVRAAGCGRRCAGTPCRPAASSSSFRPSARCSGCRLLPSMRCCRPAP